jgi:hypothetical protein
LSAIPKAKKMITREMEINFMNPHLRVEDVRGLNQQGQEPVLVGHIITG